MGTGANEDSKIVEHAAFRPWAFICFELSVTCDDRHLPLHPLACRAVGYLPDLGNVLKSSGIRYAFRELLA